MQAGQAEALLGAGRAYLYEALREGWETAAQGQMLSLALIASTFLGFLVVLVAEKLKPTCRQPTAIGTPE